MKIFFITPFLLLLNGCSVIAAAATGVFIVGPILFVVAIVAGIFLIIKAMSSSSKNSIERSKFEHQKAMDEQFFKMQKVDKPTPRAYTPTLPTQPQQRISHDTPKAKEIQECPYCREDIIVGAVICKHCRSSL